MLSIRAVLAIGIVATPSCNDDSDSVAWRSIDPHAHDAFLAAFDSVDHFALEERTDVITVGPRVMPDAGGAFLVADAKEQQIRAYAQDGSLQSVFGRPGRGPGEFTAPVSARRMATSEVVVADLTEARVTTLVASMDSVTNVAEVSRDHSTMRGQLVSEFYWPAGWWARCQARFYTCGTQERARLRGASFPSPAGQTSNA